MKKKEILEQNLPKWPAFIVRGKKVTTEQAIEIIIRTDSLFFSTNDHEFARQLYALMGIDTKGEAHFIPYDEENYEKIRIFRQELQCLDYLEYCQNHQIVSSWIGGAHGWCSWDGYIGCNNYNIGKWPSCGDVYEEWKIIAKAFPYLELRCQLLSGETCEDGIEPVIEYQISKGKVRVVKPKEFLDYAKELAASVVASRMLSFGGERGCTIELFERALELVKNKYSLERKIEKKGW